MSGDPGRLILRGGAATGAGFLVRFGARFLFLFVAARLFGPALLGAYSIALATVEIAVIAAGLGSKWLLFDWLDRAQARGEPPIWALLDATLLVGLTGAAGSGALWVAAALLPIAPATATALAILAPAVLLQTVIELLLAATRWTHAMRWEVVGKSIVQPYVQVAVAIGLAAGGWSQSGLPLSYLAASCATLVLAAIGVARRVGGHRGWRPRRDRFGAMIRASGANTAAELVDAAFARADVALTGALLGETAAGVYALAKQVSIVLRQVRQSFDGLLVPLVARNLAAVGAAATGRAIGSAARLVLVCQLPVVLALATIGDELMQAAGASFASAYPVLLLLAFAETLQGALGLGDLLFVYRRAALGLVVAVASGLCGMGAAMLLAPRLGVIGVALAVLIAYGLRAAMRSVATARILHAVVPLRGMAAPVGAAILSLALATLVTRFLDSGWPADVAGLFAALGGYAALIGWWVRRTGATLGVTGFATAPTSAA